MQVDSVATEVEPPRRLAMDFRSRYFAGHLTYDITAIEGGVILRQREILVPRRLLRWAGYSPAKVELVRRWFHGEFSPREYLPIFWRISGAYSHRSGWLALARKVADGGWRSRMRPEALIFAGRQLLDGWSVMDPPC